MLKIIRRGKTGVFQIVGTVGGQRVRESTGTASQSHAEILRARRESALLEEATWGKKHTALFLEAVKVYLHKGRAGRFVDPLLIHFGKKRMSDITEVEVASFTMLHYPKATPQTLDRQVYTPLIAIWRCANQAGLCGPHEFKRPRKPERQAVRFAKDDFLHELLPQCDQHLCAAVLLLTFGGPRASEVCRVSDEDGDVDWEQQTVLLRKTKGGRPRVVAMAPMVYEAMLPLKGSPGRLFGFQNRWSLNRAIRGACERAGLAVMTSHRIGRHAFAARLLRLGHTLKEVQEAGGWSAQSFSLVAATYGHLERSMVDKAVRAADGVLRHKRDTTALKARKNAA